MSLRKPLYGWLTSEAISLTGTRVSMIAIPWLVLTTTGSATQTGVVAFAEMAPLVLLKALAGPIVDRVGARRVAISADVASVLVVGAIPLLHLLGWLSFPALLVAVGCAGALRGPSDGAKSALVPTLVEHAGVPLERATGLASAVERTASMAGAAFAGGLVALVGASNALIVDAVSFALSALVLCWSTAGMTKAARKTVELHEPLEGGRQGYWSELRQGWDFLRGDTVLVGISAMVAVTNLLDQAYAVLLVPVWARDSGSGVAAVGLVFAVFSGASIVGSVAAAAWATRLPRFRTYVLAFLLCGAPRFVVLALGTPLWAVLAVSIVGGVASGFINPVLGAVIYERIPAPMMGRVSALNTALCWSLIPFGGVLGGLLVTAFGISPALLAIATAYFVATMAPTVGPRFRAMDHRPASPTRLVLTEEAR